MIFTYQSVRDHFIGRFGKQPMMVRSPGRINLIGEHTDYNDGFVMPAAVNKEIFFAIALAEGDQSQLVSLNYNESVNVDLKNPQPVSSPLWANYLLGVVRQFIDRGCILKPFVCVLGGNIPTGSGLSSSAALECGFAFAMNELHSWKHSKIELARIGQWSEHNFVGVRCGIMDQFANMFGLENQVIKLDCRSMEYQYLPFDLSAYDLILFNSGVKHGLASSEYNVRRAECEEGVHVMKRSNPDVKSLRDVSMAVVESCHSQFSDVVYKRCKYVVEENERVESASLDLGQTNLRAFGMKMYASHRGLSELYEVSCTELDYLVTLAQQAGGVVGARMMGGGFGGCTINLVAKHATERVVDMVSLGYRQKFDIQLESYMVQIQNGTSLI